MARISIFSLATLALALLTTAQLFAFSAATMPMPDSSYDRAPSSEDYDSTGGGGGDDSSASALPMPIYTPSSYDSGSSDVSSSSFLENSAPSAYDSSSMDNSNMGAGGMIGDEFTE
ncbi:MAG: hypothetical protein HQK52_21420 [Oligoflexia bacterium]|nr:hypothetical protein [Oligoflexia bacterium]